MVPRLPTAKTTTAIGRDKGRKTTKFGRVEKKKGAKSKTGKDRKKSFTGSVSSQLGLLQFFSIKKGKACLDE